MLTRKERDEWIQALESGKYRQGIRGMKIDAYAEGVSEIESVPEYKYCCLGVFCEINEIDIPFIGRNDDITENTHLYKMLRDKLGREVVSRLVGLNDTTGTFQDIAAYIRLLPIIEDWK